MQPEQQLKDYVGQVEKLRNRRMIKEGGGVKWSLTVDRIPDLSVSMRWDFPDEEDFRSFLMDFRRFIAPNEPIHFNKVCNTLYKMLRTNNDVREDLIVARRQWRDTLGKNGGGIRFEEQMFSPEEVIDLWLNGYYFHRDLEKYEQLDKMLSFSLPFVKAHFANFVIDATRIIIFVGHLTAYAMKHNLLKG